jgi:hypothetical protein
MPKGKPALTRKRELRAWELACEGYPNTTIARLLEAEGMGKVSDVAVGKMLRRVDRRALAEMQVRVLTEKARQTGCLEWIFQEAAAAWRRSKEQQKEITINNGPDGWEITVHFKDSVGDPAFLARMMQALKGIRDIWGVNAAPVTQVGLTLSPEQVQGLEAILAAAQARHDRAADGGANLGLAAAALIDAARSR